MKNRSLVIEELLASIEKIEKKFKVKIRFNYEIK